MRAEIGSCQPLLRKHGSPLIAFCWQICCSTCWSPNCSFTFATPTPKSIRRNVSNGYSTKTWPPVKRWVAIARSRVL